MVPWWNLNAPTRTNKHSKPGGMRQGLWQRVSRRLGEHVTVPRMLCGPSWSSILGSLPLGATVPAPGLPFHLLTMLGGVAPAGITTHLFFSSLV